MNEPSPEQRLSRIETPWSEVLQAAAGNADPAQELIMRRYGGAVYRYLLGALRDEHAADELFQEFWLRFLRGYFRNANPEKGKFRALLKAALYRLVLTYREREKKDLPQVSAVDDAADMAIDERGENDAFTESWREELLERAWAALELDQGSTRQPLFAVLRLRADRPELRSDAMATELSEMLGRPITADGVRQALKRARERFAELLVLQVAESLDSRRPEALEEEIAELGLLPYCQSALKKRN